MAKSPVDTTLEVLRDQRDDKRIQRLRGNYRVNPQIFKAGAHYIAGPIVFNTPFTITPVITFGQVSQIAVQNVSTSLKQAPTGYVPLIIHPYVYGWEQDAGSVKSFYLGLYAMTPVPATTTTYTIGWIAEGKGSSYPGQRTSESWSSGYNKNHALHLVHETNQKE